MTLSELRQGFESSLFRRGLSPATLSSYRYSLGRLERWLEKEQIDLGSLARHLAEPGLGLTRKDRRTAQTWLNWAYCEGFMLAPPVSLHIRYAVPEALTVDQVEALLEAPLQHLRANHRDGLFLATRDWAYLETLYGTGLRLGEALALDCLDLDLAQGLLRVRGKGSRERLQPLSPRLTQKVLPAYLEQRAAWALPEESALFVSREGTRMLQVSTNQMVRKRGRQAGLKVKVYPHALRRAFASHLLDAGATLEAVKDLLGHKDMQVLHRYLAMSDAALEGALSRFHPHRRR